jgi:hypothetical protein
MKRRIFEQEEKPSTDINTAFNGGYFNTLKWFTLDTKIVQPGKTKSGLKVVSGTNNKGELIIFYDGGTVKNPKTSVTSKWEYIKNPEVVKNDEQNDNVTKELERIGYTLTEPQVTSSNYSKGVYVKDLENGKYSKYVSPDLMAWPTEELTDNIKDIDLKTIKSDMKTGQINRKLCRQTIKIMYDALENPGKEYFKDDADLLLAKETCRKCATQGKNFMSGLEDKLQRLMRTSAKSNRYGLAENYDIVKTITESTISRFIIEKNKNIRKENEQINNILESCGNDLNKLQEKVVKLRKLGFNEILINENYTKNILKFNK